MPWSTNPYGVFGARTRGGVGNQQSGAGRSYPPARGGPILPSPAPPAPTPNPPPLRTSIGAGPIAVNPGPITAVIPRQKRRGAIAWQFAYVVAHIPGTTSTPVQMPGFRVPAGATVRVRASNLLGVNANPIWVGTDPTLLVTMTAQASGTPYFAGAAGTVLQSLDDVEFNVATTAEIWVLGFWKDGVILSVNKPL